jgi:hypothetical protein
MDNRNRDYYAPFGMDQFDFNALIRRRNLDELIDRLVEEGKAHWPSAENELASVEEQAEPAQTPTTPATPTPVRFTLATSTGTHTAPHRPCETSQVGRPVSEVFCHL